MNDFTKEIRSGRDASIVEPITVARELLVQWSTPRIDDQTIREFYVSKRLTTRQTAAALGTSKTNVIQRLHKMGIGEKFGGRK